jgi:3-hydroxyisobutyrate dehydrogenase-like beta-hydroxyacid dehydrogenase
MLQSVAFLGLGSMGAAMAANLLQGGFPLYVYNRTPEKAADLVSQGAKLLNSPAEAFTKAKVAITMVANDEALEQVTTQLLQSISPGSIHISMSTVSPETVRKLDKLHRDKGAFLVSAPVFGRPDVAAARKLWICLSGDPAARSQVKPILSHLGQRVEEIGDEVGSANVMKLGGNFLILSAIESMGEMIALVKENGISPEKAVAFFSETLFTSPVYHNYGKLLVESKFEPAGFKLSLGLKDINLVLKTAKASKVTMPVAAELGKLAQQGVEQGHANMDWSAITLSAQVPVTH